ncbi:conserved hypothetical protein [Theileria equi strain WA]|uniref:SURP motif domain-containing protein n=1 Tax=Theileria equi strain WA TaxID=1537102 RepID=L1LG20_THEEQ|nr:conserved hypothetical protein [Theileria equi strain WA]EKX74210.1 conserved hypothetical protein [Theileria equi strain WA]|eukprot:XP_004833662.1 conserved hypothetical protein [Theileria equi strain WA]
MASIASEVIYPPSYVRTVIDKTAQFVAKNGEQFEQKIRLEQYDGSGASSSKFSFLEPGNAYYTYYRLKLSELQGNKVVDLVPSIPQAILDKRKKLELKNKQKEQLLALSDFGSSSEALERPESDVFTFEQPYITSLDMDIIKHTALFVARNGQKFLVELTKRERSNPQFDFLNPSHHLFGYFSNLTDAYTKCLLPPGPQIERLKTIAKDRIKYLRICQRRADWDAQEAAKIEAEARRKEEERAEMQSIDWYSFFIAETINFSDVSFTLSSSIQIVQFKDDLPVPIDFSQPEALAKLTFKSLFTPKTTKEDAPPPPIVTVDDVDVAECTIPFDDDLRKSDVSNFSDVPPAKRSNREETRIVQDGDETIKVKKSYVRTKKSSGSQMQKCPITGQMVPASEMSEHLRILLLDPKWKQQKDKFMERAAMESAFAPTEDIEGNLSNFVASRPDLFGSVEDEVCSFSPLNAFTDFGSYKGRSEYR